MKFGYLITEFPKSDFFKLLFNFLENLRVFSENVFGVGLLMIF